MVCLNIPYHLRFFKGCLSQISLGPFLNTFSQMQHWFALCYFTVNRNFPFVYDKLLLHGEIL